MRLVYTENVVELALPPGHRFPIAKYDMLVEALERRHAERLFLAAPASREDLELAHDPAYVEAVVRGTLDEGRVRRLGFPWSESLVRRTFRSVGGTLAALAWAVETGASGHLAGGTHHAFRDRGEGFCTFNDLAVAALVARRDHGIRRVAIVDLDVHQGNGTAAIFADDPEVFTLSVHGGRNYPFHKERSSLDVELPDGCDDAAYLAALPAALERVAAFRPGIVLYQAGVDCLEGDRLGRLRVTLDGLARRDALVFALAKRLAVPVVVTLGGGYHRDIARSVAARAQVFEALLQYR